MIRLFIALNIPAEIKNEIIRRRDQIISSVLENSENKIFTPLKWEPEEKLHLTLKFIGEVKEELLDKIIGSIGFIQNYKPIHCAFSGFGLFFRNNEPKILWAGFNVNKKLFELVNQLNKNFIKFSIQPEHRKFKAHITLLRIKNGLDKDLINGFEKFKMNEIPFFADEVTLFKSDLLQSGSVYTPLRTFKLV